MCSSCTWSQDDPQESQHEDRSLNVMSRCKHFTFRPSCIGKHRSWHFPEESKMLKVVAFTKCHNSRVEWAVYSSASSATRGELLKRKKKDCQSPNNLQQSWEHISHNEQHIKHMSASSTDADTWPIAAVSVRLTKTTQHKRFNTTQWREKRLFRPKSLSVFPYVIHELKKTIQKCKALKHGQMTRTEDQESLFPDTGYTASPASDFWHSCIPTFYSLFKRGIFTYLQKTATELFFIIP